MADCECLPKCPFFNDKMANMPAVANMYKKQFCQGDNSTCARYRVNKSGAEVPVDLFPNDSARADKIIAGGKS